jgi:rhodanese-related sulfurtransferase
MRRGLLICFVAGSLGVLVNAVSPWGIPLLGPVPAGYNEGVTGIELGEAWALYSEGNASFVDARSPQEFCAGHIPGALSLTLDDFEETVASWKNLIPLETLLVTYCSGEGCDSSREVAVLLVEEGYSQVKVFFGGWEHWKEAGYPVEKESSEGERAG